jgi:hypothetical protein
MWEASCGSMVTAIIIYLCIIYYLFIHHLFIILSTCSDSMHEVSYGNTMPAIIILFIYY